MRKVRQFGVIGLGRFGARVATGLYARGAEIVAVDSDPVKVDAIKSEVTSAIRADATHRAALEAIAMDQLDAVIVGIGRDVEASILVTALLREIGCDKIIARAGSDLHADILQRVGASGVVYPEDDVAMRLVRTLSSPRVVDLVELEGNVDFALVEMPRDFVGKTLRELALRPKYGLTVVAIHRPGAAGEEPDVVIPGPDDALQAGDRMYLVGNEEALSRIDHLA